VGVDAGSISSEVRIKLSALNADIKACQTAFDNLGTEFKNSAEKYSTLAGQRYTNTLKNITKEMKNVEGAMQAGAISESNAVERLIALRKRELQVLQDKAVKEGTASKETVAAIKKTEEALGLLVEKQKLLGNKSSGSIFDTFAKMRDVVLGPIGAFKEVAAVIGQVMAKVDELENEWGKQEDALAILNSVLKSTGAESWTSMDHLTGMAASLQKVTTYGDETIEAMQGVLLGFRNITGDNFDEATKAVLDMATVMKMDLTAAAQAVGKALDNPALGLDSLSKQGFKFTEQEKDMLKQMQATGNIAGAQRIILDELAKTFGGASEAVGETATGLKVRLKNAIGDVNEEIGRSIANNLAPFRKLWLNLAEAIGAAAKAQNDFREMIDRSNKGTATTADRVTLLDMRLKQLKDDLAGSEVTGGYFEGSAESIKNAIEATENEIKAVKALEAARLSAANAVTEAEKKAAEKAKATAEAEARQAKITSDRLAVIQEYETTLGRINLLQSSGAITSKDADEQKLAAVKAEVDALMDLVEANKLTEGATVDLRDEKLRLYAAMKKYLEDSTEENKKALEAEVALTKAREDANKKANDEYAAVQKGNQALEDLAKNYGISTEKLKLKNATEEEAIEFERQLKIAEIEASKGTQEEKAKAIAALNKYYDALKDKTALDAVKNNWKGMWESLKSSAFSVISSIVDIYTASLDKQLDALKKAQAEELKAFEKTKEAETEALEKAQEAQTEALEKAHAAQTEALDAEYQHKQELIEYDGLTYAQYLQKQIDDAIAAGDAEAQAEAEKKLALYNLQVQHDADVKALAEKQAAEEKALEEKKAAEKKALEEKQAAEKTALERQQAYDSAQIQYKADMAQYAADIVTAGAQAALAIIKCFSELGPVGGAISAAVVGVATAAQIAAIVAAKPTEPTFATGGIVLGSSYSGDKITARVNSGEMILNMEQQQRLFDMLNGAAAPSSSSSESLTIPISLVLDGQVVAQVVVQRINNGNVKVITR
jgi:hypothetical protein